MQSSKGELIRLRHLLGHLAAQAGFDAVVLDASDVVLGEDESEDHARCCDAVRHIRSALRLSTQSSKRVARSYSAAPDPPSVFRVGNEGVGIDDDSSSEGESLDGDGEAISGQQSKQSEDS